MKSVLIRQTRVAKKAFAFSMSHLVLLNGLIYLLTRVAAPFWEKDNECSLAKPKASIKITRYFKILQHL